MINKLTVLAILGALAVAIGAFGAHGLERFASTDNLDIFRTGNRYHFYHLLLLFLAIWAQDRAGASPRLLNWSFRLALVGILLFSGSLYLLGLRDGLTMNINWLGAVTPLGGLALIGGWVCLGLAVMKNGR